MPFKESCTTPLANCHRLFPSHDGLRNELFPIWQHALSTMAVCNADGCRLRVVLILLFTYKDLCRKIAPVPAFLHAALCTTTRKNGGLIEIEAVSTRTSSSV